MYKRTNQGGSVVSFVIVGVVLAALVAGGVYLVNQRTNDKPTEQQPGTTGQNQSTSQPSTSSNTGSSQTNTNTGTGSQNSGSSSQSQTGTSNGQSSTQSSTPTTGVTQTTPSNTNGHLPTTGPVDDGLRLVLLAILIGVATAYVRSFLYKRQPSTL